MSDWIDPDGAPVLTRDFFDRAEIRDGETIVRTATGGLSRRGRPPVGANVKKQVTLRIDSDVLESFRSSGPGWQSRINAILRHVAHLA